MVRLEPAGDQSVLDAEFLDTGDENEYNPKLEPVDISIYLGTPDFHSFIKLNASLKLNLLSNEEAG